MFNLRTIVPILIICLLTISCDKESEIIPSNDELTYLRFKFPQGESMMDEKTWKIYEKFHVKIIYKNYQQNDFNLNWVSVGAKRVGTDVAMQDQEKAINFLIDEVFAYLTPDVTKGVLPRYFYLADSVADYYIFPNILESYQPISYIFDGFDSWCFTWNGRGSYIKDLISSQISIGKGNPSPQTAFSRFYKRGVILKEVIRQSINNGNIKVLSLFNRDFDFKTPISSNRNDANFSFTRGFPGQFTNSKAFEITSISNVSSTNEKQNFIDYVMLCMRYAPDSIEIKYPKSEYPLIHAKYPIVLKYMKEEYELDLLKIATK